MARGARTLSPVENQPTAHRARVRWRFWRGCLRGQLSARSTPRCWPRLLFTDTAPGCRLRLRNAATEAFLFRGARPACASPRGEPADRPQSTCALADLAWLSARPTCATLHPTPLAEASLHRHRARSAVAASNFRNQNLLVPWCAARGRFAPWIISRPPTEHALCAVDLAWLSSRLTRGALHSTPLTEAQVMLGLGPNEHRGTDIVARLA